MSRKIALWLGMLSLPALVFASAVGIVVFYYVQQRTAVLRDAPLWEHVKRHHHVRDMVPPGRYPDSRSLIFTEVAGDPSSRRTLLIQGDSWAEQMVLYDRTMALWQRWSKEHGDMRIVNAGTASYGPSPETAQLQSLSDSFGVRPDAIVLIVDQTDVGDEGCRYRDKTTVDDRGMVSVAPEDIESGDTPRYWQLEMHNRMQDGRTSGIKNFFAFYAMRARQRFRNEARMSGDEMQCGWSRVSQWLRDGNDADARAFEQALHRYINVALARRQLECLIVVTHPHRAHLASLPGEMPFRWDVLGLVADVVRSTADRRLSHLNLGPEFAMLYGGRDVSEVFYPHDRASHLTRMVEPIYAGRIAKEVAMRCTQS
jgi:hypothetical protein